jgi:hypothetical protein
VDPAGEQVCKLTLYHLSHCLSALATKVGEWQENRLLERTHSMHMLIQHLNHQLYVSEQNSKHLTFLRKLDAKIYKKRVEVEVADRGLDLIMEINHNYKELSTLKRTLEEQEKKIRASVRIEYEDLVKELSAKLVTKTHQQEQQKNQIYQDLIGQLSSKFLCDRIPTIISTIFAVKCKNGRDYSGDSIAPNTS